MSRSRAFWKKSGARRNENRHQTILFSLDPFQKGCNYPQPRALNPQYMPNSPRPSSRQIKTIEHPGWLESHATLQGPASAEDLHQAREQLPGGMEAAVLGVDLFGTAAEISGMEEAVKRAGISAPVTSVLSSSPCGGGVQFVAVTGIEPSPLVLRDRLRGYLIEGRGSSHCFLGGLLPGDPGASRGDQTQDVFATIEETLALAGMGFEDVVRTWFYNERILEWYPAFNGVRTEFFERHAITRMPASTGIGAPNPAGTALVAKALAVRPGAGEIRVCHSPLQCDAFAYGSAFSRALEVSDSCSRTLYISGTASIDPVGQSTRLGDAAGQIGLTMDVVRAIIDEAGMKPADATRAIAYFRDPAHVPLWDRFCPPGLPSVSLGCHVCRDDLLFEIEIDVSTTVTIAFPH
jgi:enamine deaminase RidA (YjgF/YER057c/UK114 family)